MKRILRVLALPVLMGVSGAASASDFGCQVLLCLANPQGPTAVAECVPPIKKLFRDLAKGKPFPSCTLSNGGTDTSNFARQTTNYYPTCPDGLTPLPVGETVDTGGGLLKGIGDGEGESPMPMVDGTYSLPAMACVGRKTGTRLVELGNEDRSSVLVSEYDRVQYVQPNASGNVIEVFMNGRLYNRITY